MAFSLADHYCLQTLPGFGNDLRLELFHGWHRKSLGMRMDGQPLGSIDFNKLLPMPKELDMEAGTRTDRGLKLVREYHHTLADLERQKPGLTPAEYALALHKCEELYQKQRLADPVTWALGEQAYSNVQRFGSPTWYEWCNLNWGTKWNAYQPRPLREDDHTMVFFTAWDSVPKIVTLLSRKYPEQTITYRWADENIGYNVGEMTMKGGEVIDINVPEGGSREAYEMAAEIMDTDLSDYDLCLTADGNSYPLFFLRLLIPAVKRTGHADRAVGQLIVPPGEQTRPIVS